MTGDEYTRYYKRWKKQHEVTLRHQHNPGQQAFIDYAGTTIPIYCRKRHEIIFQAEVFLMVLGYSHYTFAYATRTQALADWIDAHMQAFDYFGGVSQQLVPDNLKSGISDSCQFEPEANPTYADMAAHYNTAIIPARPAKPRDRLLSIKRYHWITMFD